MNLRERFEKENPIKIVKDGDRLKIRADVHFIRESKYAKWLEALIKSQADELENDSKCYNTMIKVKNDLQAELASLQKRIDEATTIMKLIYNEAVIDLDSLDKQTWPLRVYTHLELSKFLELPTEEEQVEK